MFGHIYIYISVYLYLCSLLILCRCMHRLINAVALRKAAEEDARRQEDLEKIFRSCTDGPAHKTTQVMNEPCLYMYMYMYLYV
jgi:hypothetical protein